MAEMSRGEDAPISSVARAMEDNPSERDERPVYEIGFHVVPTQGEAGAARVLDEIRSELSKASAAVIAEQVPQKMTLMYTIERASTGKREKFSDSYFGFIKFSMEREHIRVLEDMLRASRDILRYLLIETERDDVPARRAIFTSDRLEGETIRKPTAAPEKKADVSEEELEKSIEAIIS